MTASDETVCADAKKTARIAPEIVIMEQAMRVLVIFAALAVSSPAVLAQEAELATNPFNEILHERAQISGPALTGVLGEVSRDTEAPLLSAHIPAGWTEICTSVISADGLYEARNDYRIPDGWAGGTINLPYPTQRLERLSALEGGTVAVLTRQGNCSAPENRFAVAYWRSEPDMTQASLLINSFRADEVVAYVGNDPNAPEVACTNIEGSSLTAFDTMCEIILPADGNEIEVELLRVRAGQSDPAEYITIYR